MSIFPARILLTTDGSEEAQLALQTAVDLANSTGSELHVVTAGGEEEAQKTLDEQAKKIEEAGEAIAGAHLRTGGRPDDEIVALGEELAANLMVVGSRGLGGVRRTLMGSVSDSVVRKAHCPVLVVRAQTQALPPEEAAEGEKPGFWNGLFGPYYSQRHEKVLSYVIHRIGEGANLREVLQEAYVRRLASPDEVQEILDNPKLVEAAREKMGEDFYSGRLDPKPKPAPEDPDAPTRVTPYRA